MAQTAESRRTAPRFPPHGWLGLGLVALFWALNWGLGGMRTHILFFPLWLGFCLAIDGINVYRTGTSLLTRSWRRYIFLFLFSIPVWWLFEVLNWRVQNWHYLGRELLTDFEYLIISSFSFSTVIPAVLGASELFASFGFIRDMKPGRLLKPTPRTTRALFIIGMVMFVTMMAWPGLFFPWIWIFAVLLIEPVNVWLGNQSVLKWTGRGDWRPILALFGGVLLCGIFWEMWNYLSFPKWVYTVPFFGFLHVFEMPLLGYLGYLPFSLEILAVTHLLFGLLGQKDTDYVMGIYSQTHRR